MDGEWDWERTEKTKYLNINKLDLFLETRIY